MCKKKIKPLAAAFLIAMAIAATDASAQVAASTSISPAARSTQGQLTVTLTIVSSVGLVTGTDGVQRLVVANAPDPADNVSVLKVIPPPDPVEIPQRKNPSKKNGKNHRG